jgi:prophage regulatory protein
MIDNRIIRLRELKILTGLSAATIWRKEKENTFPKRRRISKRAVGWIHNEVSQWIDKQIIMEKADAIQ